MRSPSFLSRSCLPLRQLVRIIASIHTLVATKSSQPSTALPVHRTKALPSYCVPPIFRPSVVLCRPPANQDCWPGLTAPTLFPPCETENPPESLLVNHQEREDCDRRTCLVFATKTLQFSTDVFTHRRISRDRDFRATRQNEPRHRSRRLNCQRI